MGQARVGQIFSKKPGSCREPGAGCGNFGRQGMWQSIPPISTEVLNQRRLRFQRWQVASPADKGVGQGDAELLIVLGQGTRQCGVALLAGGGIGARHSAIDLFGIDRLPLAGGGFPLQSGDALALGQIG